MSMKRNPEGVVREIKRKARRRFSAEEEIRIVPRCTEEKPVIPNGVAAESVRPAPGRQNPGVAKRRACLIGNPHLILCLED